MTALNTPRSQGLQALTPDQLEAVSGGLTGYLVTSGIAGYQRPDATLFHSSSRSFDPYAAPSEPSVTIHAPTIWIDTPQTPNWTWGCMI